MVYLYVCMYERESGYNLCQSLKRRRNHKQRSKLAQKMSKRNNFYGQGKEKGAANLGCDILIRLFMNNIYIMQ